MADSQLNGNDTKELSDSVKAKSRLHPTVVAAIIGAVATVIVAVLGSPYLAKWMKGPESTPVDRDKVDGVEVVTPGTFSPTDFVGRLRYHPPYEGTGKRIEVMQLTPSADVPSTEDIAEHLDLVEVSSDPTTDIFKITVLIKNVWNEPIILDLQRRSFRLENDHGQNAELIASRLPQKGTILRKSAERRCELYFRAPGWQGKLGPKLVYFHIEGLGTIDHAAWKCPLFVAAE